MFHWNSKAGVPLRTWCVCAALRRYLTQDAEALEKVCSPIRGILLTSKLLQCAVKSQNTINTTKKTIKY